VLAFANVFVIPGIVLLVIFILARPQEFVPLLLKVPFLHLAVVFAAFGFVVDLRLRRLQFSGTNTLWWVIAFFAWALLSTAINAPAALVPITIELATLFVLYGTIAHGVQRLRTLQLIVGVVAVTCLFIALVCFQQGLSAHQCIGGRGDGADVLGAPDGRSCEVHQDCTTAEAEPGLDYRCERVGMLGTFTIDDRVRYIGELHDPNEVALTVSAAGIAMLIGFALRKRRSGTQLAVGIGVALLVQTILMTQSRGGLVAAMLVPGVYVVRRFGFAAIIPAAVLALPVLLMGGRSGADADASTMLRYEAWASGLEMFKHSPLYGVGARQFTEHHWLAAHNSYVLALAELGIVGMFLFVSILYLAIKTLYVGLRTLADVPGAAAARVWGMGLLSSMAGILFQINTLSFAYHSVLWLFLGLVGAWYSAVRHHMPQLVIKMAFRDLVVVIALCVGYALVAMPVFLKYKGEL